MFCLTKDLASEFKKRLVNGEINPGKLMDMDSKTRRQYFESFLGRVNAQKVNAEFESKMILKNQKRGIITWAKQISGMKPEVQRGLIARVEKMDKILEPKELDKFLNDLVAKKLGVEVSPNEAKNIAELSARVTETRQAMESGGDRLDYGWAQVQFYNYVNGLKNDARVLSKKEKILEIPSFAKSIVSSLDNSAIGRQGLRTLFNNPLIWGENAAKSFQDLVRGTAGKDVMDALNADIFSRPTYNLMQKGKLAIGNLEEAFPSTLAEKIPLFGRIYKASQDTFTAFIHKTRADVFDEYLKIAQKSGLELDQNLLEDMGKIVNALTGRASLGKYEGAADLTNKLFFSSRWVISHLDALTFGQGNLKSSGRAEWFVRRKAATNTLRTIMGVGAILTIANAVSPGSVEWDPRSSNFGKIRVKDTRFDVTAGMASFVTLFSRIVTQSSKSSTTGKIIETNSDEFNSMKNSDLIWDFMNNKLAPAFRAAKDIIDQQTFEGDPVTVASTLKTLFVPLPVQNAIESFKDPNSANLAAIMIADGLGISASTWSKKQTEAEQMYEKLKEMPDKEREEEFILIQKRNDVLFKQIQKLKENEALGITPEDESMADMGVANYERSTYIWEKMDGFSKDERMEYMAELKRKKVLSETVFEQLNSFEKVGGPPDEIIEAAQNAEDEDELFGLVGKYAEAFKTDPVSAFETMFTKQQLDEVRNGTVIYKRITGSDESYEVKKEMGYGGSVAEKVKLDHIIPIKLGGADKKDNWRIVDNAEWERTTPIENYLIDLLDAGKIDEKQGAELIMQFKNYEITEEEIKSQFN